MGLTGPFFFGFCRTLAPHNIKIGDILELAHSLLQRLESAIMPLLEANGYELVLLEYAGRARTLRLYVDSPAGINLDDCSRVSHLVSDLLDAEGVVDGAGGISGRYTLEVSSPGLDRPLVKPKDFQRYVGRLVVVSTRQPVSLDGRKKCHGKLVTADELGIQMDVDGKPIDIPYGIIDRARLVPEL